MGVRFNVVVQTYMHTLWIQLRLGYGQQQVFILIHNADSVECHGVKWELVSNGTRMEDRINVNFLTHMHILESIGAGVWLVSSFSFDSHAHSVKCLKDGVGIGIKWNWGWRFISNVFDVTKG